MGAVAEHLDPLRGCRRRCLPARVTSAPRVCAQSLVVEDRRDGARGTAAPVRCRSCSGLDAAECRPSCSPTRAGARILRAARPRRRQSAAWRRDARRDPASTPAPRRWIAPSVSPPRCRPAPSPTSAARSSIAGCGGVTPRSACGASRSRTTRERSTRCSARSISAASIQERLAETRGVLVRALDGLVEDAARHPAASAAERRIRGASRDREAVGAAAGRRDRAWPHHGGARRSVRQGRGARGVRRPLLTSKRRRASYCLAAQIRHHSRGGLHGSVPDGRPLISSRWPCLPQLRTRNGPSPSWWRIRPAAWSISSPARWRSR